MTKGAYIGVDGVARKIKKAYIGIGGIARLCYSADNFAIYGEDWTNDDYVWGGE